MTHQLFRKQEYRFLDTRAKKYVGQSTACCPWRVIM